VLKCTVTINGSGGTLLSGEPGVVFTGVGAGTDSSDKAPMKACAAALKYALTSGFLIATGDDPEDDGEDETPEPKKRPAARAEKQPTEAAEGGGTDAAMKAALEIAECASVSELDAMIPELSKLKAKLAKADYETLSATFKAKKAELQEKK
jgi:hypothetical protein